MILSLTSRTLEAAIPENRALLKTSNGDQCLNYRRYSIHGFVDIMLHPGLTGVVESNILFQIRHFEVPDDSPVAPRKITVNPYVADLPAKDPNFVLFHLKNGIQQEILDDPDERIAFRVEGENYEIFTDSPNFLINLFIQLTMNNVGISLVHAAAVVDGQNNVTLLPGAGGVGKTGIVGHLVSGGGYKLLGDDIVGVSKSGDCYSFPRSFVLKEYHKEIYPHLFSQYVDGDSAPGESVGIRVRRNLLRAIRDNVPFLGVMKYFLRGTGLYRRATRTLDAPPEQPYLAAVPVDEVIGRENVADSGKLKRVVFLTRYSGPDLVLRPISKESLVRRMHSIIHHEWVDSMRQFFAMGAVELLDLPRYWNTITSIIGSSVDGVTIEELLIPTGCSPDEIAKLLFSVSPR